LWFGLSDLGLKTLLESAEPSRSDCHAWGAHPVFHLYATILGIRPAKPAMEVIHIEPQFGPLDWVHGEIPHPRAGTLKVHVSKLQSGRLEGIVCVPAGSTALVTANGSTHSMSAGENHFS